jgi:hypothetical protein
MEKLRIPPTNAKALQRALGFFHFSKFSGIIDVFRRIRKRNLKDEGFLLSESSAIQ